MPMTIPAGTGATSGGSSDKTYVPGEDEPVSQPTGGQGGDVGGAADAAAPQDTTQSPTGSPVAQPHGGQGDLSAEIERGERATHSPDEDMGEGSGEPFYAN